MKRINLLYPPGFGTNGFTIFEASQSQVQALTKAVLALDKPATTAKSVKLMASESSNAGSFAAYNSSSSPAPSSQSTVTPVRPPNNPIKNAAGTIGIAYEQYLPQGFPTSHGPRTGWPYPVQPQYVAIDGVSATTGLYFDRIVTAKTIGDNFSQAMEKGGWITSFNKSNNSVTATDLEKTSLGGKSIFNNVNFGVLLGHGSYATTAENDSVKYSYFWLLSNGSPTPMRLGDFDFGGSDPINGLRWMTDYSLQRAQSNRLQQHE